MAKQAFMTVARLAKDGSVIDYFTELVPQELPYYGDSVPKGFAKMSNKQKARVAVDLFNQTLKEGECARRLISVQLRDAG